MDYNEWQRRYWASIAAMLDRNRRIAESAMPIQSSLVRDLARQQRYFESLGLSLARNAFALNEAVANTCLRPLSEIAVRMATLVEAPTRRVAESFRPIVELQARVAGALAVREYPAIAAVLEEWQRVAAEAEARGVSREVFAEQVLRQLQQAAQASDETGYSESVQAVSDEVRGRLAELPRSRLSFECMLQIWLMILIFLVQYAKDTARDAVIDARLDELSLAHERVSHAIEELRPPADDPVLFKVAVRRVLLRGGPSSDHVILRELRPGTLLAVLRRRGQWLRVEVFDPAKAEPVVGWVYNRFLRDAPPLVDEDTAL